MKFNPYNKYHNKSTIVNGIRFSSKKEAKRYQDLKLLEENGDIKDLKLQSRFNFPMGVFYKGDFSYLENGKLIVEDVKGVKTAVFILKIKCFKYFYPDIELRIT